MASREKSDFLRNNGHSVEKINLPKADPGNHDSDDRWVELLDDLERLLQGIRHACSLTADESDDIRSDLVLRLLTILVKEQVMIRVSLEAWLRDLIRREIREYFGQIATQPKLVLVDKQYLSQIVTFTNDEHETEPVTGRKNVRQLLQAIETVRRKVDKTSWEIFIDIAVHKTPVKIAAARHGKSYSAAQKIAKRVEEMLRKQADDPNHPTK